MQLSFSLLTALFFNTHKINVGDVFGVLSCMRSVSFYLLKTIFELIFHSFDDATFIGTVKIDKGTWYKLLYSDWAITHFLQ